MAQFSKNDSVKSVLKYISQIMNCYYIIHSEREIRFIFRGENNGTVDLEWDKNVVKSKPKFGFWKHFYDATVVQYKNLFIDIDEGEKKDGYDGWKRNVLRIDNILIQNSHTAKIVSNETYNYFNTYRLNPVNIQLIHMPQLECIDLFNLIMPIKMIDIDSSIDFIISSIELKSDRKIFISGIEV